MDRKDILQYEGVEIAAYFIGGIRKTGIISYVDSDRFYIKKEFGKFIPNNALIAIGDRFA